MHKKDFFGGYCDCLFVYSYILCFCSSSHFFVYDGIYCNYSEWCRINRYYAGGIWKLGMKKGKEYCLFFKVSMEEFDKSIIYKYLQEINGFDFEEVNGRMFIGNILMDSISDRKDYLTETVKKGLEKEFLYCDNYKLRRYTADYLRMIKIFYCYLLNMGEKQDAIKRRIDNNWREIEAECYAYRFGRKLLEAISHKEQYSINNYYEIYNKKMNLIYK